MCLAGQRVGIQRPLTDRYGQTVQAGCWGKLVCGWCGRRGASIVACLRKINVDTFRHCYPALRWSGVLVVEEEEEEED